MKKIKVTKKEMRDNYLILGAGYCNMQFLLNYQKPVAYSAGVYGWACDYYDVNGIVISTGYSYINTKNMRNDYNLINKYEKKAEKIYYDHNLKYDTKKRKSNNLLYKLLNELMEAQK